MSEQTIPVEELSRPQGGAFDSARKQLNTFTETAHRTLLAGVGAVLLVGDEVGNMLVEIKERAQRQAEEARSQATTRTNELIERGQRVESDLKVRFEHATEKRQSDIVETTDDAQSRLRNTVSDVLHRLNVPTRQAIEELNKNVTALARKVDRLRKTQEEQVTELPVSA